MKADLVEGAVRAVVDGFEGRRLRVVWMERDMLNGDVRVKVESEDGEWRGLWTGARPSAPLDGATVREWVWGLRDWLEAELG